MSGSAEERDQASGGGTVDVLQARDHEGIPSREAEAPATAVDRIRGIAANLDVHHLREEELTALSNAALSLLDVAKAQLRDRDIASLRTQIEDWERQHAEKIAGAGADVVADALVELGGRIDEGEMDQDDVSATLHLLGRWLRVDAHYQATGEELTLALGETDFESVRSLTDVLQALDTDRSEAATAIDAALAKPGPTQSTQEELAADDATKSEPETTEPADSMEEATASTPVSSSSGDDAPDPDPTEENVPAVGDEGEERDAEVDSATQADDGEPSGEAAGDPGVSHDDDAVSTQRIEDAIAMSIKQGRVGLAYHLALAQPDALPSANAIKLAAYSYVAEERAPLAAELFELAAALLHEAQATGDTGSSWRSHVFFTTCAALEPALAAPGGPVAQLLTYFQRWLDDTPSLRTLAKTAADVSMTGVRLPMDLLREEDSLERWRSRKLALRNETRAWITNERQSTIKFHAATRVWKRMLEEWQRPNGQSSLGRLFALLDQPIEDIDTEEVAQISEYWRDNGEKEIDRIDRENRSWKSTKIEGSARSSLRTKVNQALVLADRWLRLIAERPDKRLPFHTEQAKILRATVHNTVDQASSEIDVMPIHKAEAARTLLRRYATLFDSSDGKVDRRHVSMTDLLNGDLLADAGIVFDAAGQPSDSPFDSGLLWNLVKQEQPDFGQAAMERAQRGDFFGAEAALDFAERTGRIDQVRADRSRAAIEDRRDQIQSKLKAKITETSDRLDAAYAAGALTLETYEEQHDRIPLDDSLQTNTFGPLFAILEGVNTEIDDAEARRRHAIRQSLEELDGLSQEDEERIEAALDSGRFQVAEDFIVRIEHGQELPAPKTTDGRPFDQFFPHFVEKYSTLRDSEGDGVLHAQSVIGSRDSDEFIDASDLSEDASRDGIDLLEAWTTLRDGQTSMRALGALMSAFGFEHAMVHPTNEETLGGERVFELHALPVADRGIVQLPDFGSRADGRYRLIAVRRRTTEEAIIREVSRPSGSDRPPNIALFFGVLDTDARRSLARTLRTGEYHSTIVLDESLVVFLAAWPRNRHRAFFDCVSAFTFSQPYEPDAAELPPEMFFGRAAARRAILAKSHDMAHFVYGGRRLGKTTLLADVAREYRTKGPEASETLVLLINLKGSGIGENRPTEDLWPMFAKKLGEHGVVRGRTRRAESVSRSVKQWLEKKQGRRILLLVDEADAFLDAERRPKHGYRVLEQVKRLMEETERRFKVVFAGLHNVQRAARDPNTPFAHLGEPIRIGPMLPETDGDEIQSLIRGPVEALGYRFVSNDSVIRIAAETNYYPALAQQFCKELLKTLNEMSHALDEVGPPYPIRSDLIDDVFRARETRDRIRNLFRWTIELDDRYKFLTYLIAQRSFDNENGRPQAMPITAIRDDALSEWPEGFASDSSFWTFEVLLEEMVDLGILRETKDKEFAIRTRNLRMLLGDDKEIERRFADAKNKMAPPIFDRGQFRRTLKDGTSSSLTADQESRLLYGRKSVGVVFGTRLAGIHRVGDSLEGTAAKWDESLFIKRVEPGAALRVALRGPLKSRKSGTHVVLFDMRGAWDVEMLRRAIAFVKKRDWQDRIVRPVFLCGAKEAWRWLNDTVPSDERVELHDIWLGPCGRDFTRTWLKDQESRAYADLEKPDKEVDFPWPLVLQTAANNKKLESIDEAITTTLDDDKHRRHVGDVLGISENVDTALRLLSTFHDALMTPDILSDLCEVEETTMSLEEVERFFNWASHLGVVRKDRDKERKGYRLDRTYAEGLRRAFGG